MAIRIRTATTAACAATLATAMATALSLTAPAQAGNAPPTLTPMAAPAPSAAHTVRLVTGDTVTVVGRGERARVVFTPDSDSPTGTARVERFRDDITVIPEEAVPLLRAGRLDSALFDVDQLIAQGYGDGAGLPLIVKQAGSAAPELAPGAEVTRVFPTLRRSAVKVKDKAAKGFWAGLRDRSEGAGPTRLAGGVQKVWLDGKVHAALDTSVPQIGAPQAWAAGYDGTGVKVAVLDTGVDATHPDLAGKIVSTRNFTAESSATDGQGHGTHVASTIAGSGAASGGRQKGVAPGAQLLVGKVLDDQGSGTDSQVLAGMEWAARSGAEIVNMSLGNPQPSDGTDPLSTALNELTEETDTLFVVAGGNTGPRAVSLGAPGVAAGALTVAAVDDEDRLAPFSSRGPVHGDGASLKPDIAAPGVGIVAARAAGTDLGSPVDDSYTSLNGTSMATPHVAGAAAILAGRHPDWSPARLKGVLMATADVLPEGAYGEGSGRVDVPAALDGTVWADTASFGTFRANGPLDPVTRTVTFHNTGARPVTLDLAVRFVRDGDTAPISGALSLGTSSLTIPAGGSVPVPVVHDPASKLAVGTYTGTVTATGDGVTAHATVALTKRPAMYDLRVRLLDRAGKPTSGRLNLLHRDGTAMEPVWIEEGGTTLPLTVGKYSLFGYLTRGNSITAVGDPDVDVTDRDVEVVFDASKARPVTVETPRDAELSARTLSIMREADGVPVRGNTQYIMDRREADVYALPSKSASGGGFGLGTYWSLRQRPYEARAHLPEGVLDLAADSPAYALPVLDGVRELRTVDAGHGTPAETDAAGVAGRLALVRRGSEAPGSVVDRLTAAGAAAVMFVNDTDGAWPPYVFPTVPVFAVPRSQGDRVAAALARGDVKVTLTGHRAPAFTYQLYRVQRGAFAADQHYRPDPDTLASVDVSDYSPSGGDLSGTSGWLPVDPYLDGVATANGRTRWPNRHTDHLDTTGISQWHNVADTEWPNPTLWGTPLSPRAGDRLTLTRGEPVLRPATYLGGDVDSGVPPTRTGSRMLLNVAPRLGTGNGSHESVWAPPGEDTLFSLFHEGRLVGSSAVATAALVDGLPAEDGEYQVVIDSRRPASAQWALSTAVHSAWTFRSSATRATERLPMLIPDVTVKGISLYGTVRAGTAVPVAISFRDTDGRSVEPATAKLEVSFDGGATWTAPPTAALRQGTLGATLPPVAGARSLSLRYSGEDAKGNKVDQTVIDAALIR